MRKQGVCWALSLEPAASPGPGQGVGMCETWKRGRPALQSGWLVWRLSHSQRHPSRPERVTVLDDKGQGQSSGELEAASGSFRKKSAS